MAGWLNVGAALALLGLMQPCWAEQSFRLPAKKVPFGQPKVVHASPVPGERWPGTLISTAGTPAEPIQCTATVIGPRVVLSAAHCVQNGATMNLAVDAGPVSVTCTHHSGYAPFDNYRNDIALCLADAPIALMVGARYERLNRDAGVLGKGDRVRLIGYGCVREGGPFANVLYTGSTLFQMRYDGRIVLAGGELAVLCEGDSGGAAYRETPPEAPVSRIVLGVNSTRGLDFKTSTITDVAAPQIAEFIVAWSSARGVEICGYDAASVLCYP